jgi:hypothetical protein
VQKVDAGQDGSAAAAAAARRAEEVWLAILAAAFTVAPCATLGAASMKAATSNAVI